LGSNIILYNLIIAVFFLSPKLSADQLTSLENHPFIKCETPRAMEIDFSGAGKIASRLDLDTSVLSSLGHFRVHYDTSGYHAPDPEDLDLNGIPDYVDSTLVYLEHAWDLQVNQLGYDPPMDDNGEGGGDEIDLYIKEYGSTAYYGVSKAVNKVNGSSSAYIEMDSNFKESQYASKGYDAVRITTAHEFFHVIQFRYSYDLTLSWWMEQSAVWMEEREWDDVNDYLAYLPYFFNYKSYALDSNTGNYKYGAAIWAIYLAKKFGDDQIKWIWKQIESTGKLSISVFDEVIPAGLGEAYREFMVWNYFTNDRANTFDFFPDSDMFDNYMGMDYRADFSPTLVDFNNINHLSSKYTELLFANGWGEHDAVRVNVIPGAGGSFKSSLVFYNSPDEYTVHVINPGGEEIPLKQTWDKVVVITSCTNFSNSNYEYTLDTEILSGVYVENSPLYALKLHGAYPNPFNPSTTIRFALSEPGYVSVRVFNSQGQMAAELYSGNLTAGEKRIFWKPENLAGGIYFINITTPHGTKTTKSLFLK
jgi:hypothetical protein